MEDKTNLINIISKDHHQNTTSVNLSCASTNPIAWLDSTDTVLSNSKPKKNVLARCMKRMNRIFSPFKRNRNSPWLDRKPLYVDSSNIHQPLDSTTMLEDHKGDLKDANNGNRDLFNCTYLDAKEKDVQAEYCQNGILSETTSDEKMEEKHLTEYHRSSKQQHNRIDINKPVERYKQRDLHTFEITNKHSIRFNLVSGSIKRTLKVGGKRDAKTSTTTNKNLKETSIEEEEVSSLLNTHKHSSTMHSFNREDILEGEIQKRLGS